MRIVHIITRFVSGGADENTLLTCNHQAALGHDVWLVHGAEVADRMLRLMDDRVTAISLPSLVRDVHPVKDLAALARLARFFRRTRPDVIHTHTSKAGVVGRIAAMTVLDAKVVHSVHILPFTGEPLPKRLVYLALEKAATVRTDAFIDVSEGMRDLCLENSLGTPANHHVIFSGMDVESFCCAEPAGDLAGIRRDGNEILLGYVAVLERRKRHRELVASLRPLLSSRANVHLVLAGEGPERPALEEAISAAGLEKQVHIFGFREDIPRFIAACDLCLFASEREGLPRSIVQYAIAGKPIVATYLPGIERIVREGKNGHVVGEQDFDGFSAKIENLVADAGRRSAFAATSAALDLSDWDAGEMVERIQQVYEGISPAASRVNVAAPSTGMPTA